VGDQLVDRGGIYTYMYRSIPELFLHSFPRVEPPRKKMEELTLQEEEMLL
jgi:hypothetical protein